MVGDVPLLLSSVLPCAIQDEEDVLNRKRSDHVMRKLAARKSQAKVDPHLEEQFLTGRLLGVVWWWWWWCVCGGGGGEVGGGMYCVWGGVCDGRWGRWGVGDGGGCSVGSVRWCGVKCSVWGVVVCGGL